MRPDMAKVIVERPRTGGTERKRHLGGRNADLEDLPFKESMKAAYANRKSLNENLAPLKRYLQKQIGRPWEVIYSEICKRLRNDSAVQKHVKDHIFGFVEIHAVIIGGYPHYKQSWGGTALRRLRKGDMYIDPETRLLSMVTKEFKEHKTVSPIIDAMITRLRYLGVNHTPWGDETRTILWQVFCAGVEKKKR